MSFHDNYCVYLTKMEAAFANHQMSVPKGHFRLSDAALAAAQAGDWTLAVQGFAASIEVVLRKVLTSSHVFLSQPYVRNFDFGHRGRLSTAIVNNQSLEWYGREGAASAFDFLLEYEKGLFGGCKRFLDLGGHHMVWACFYAKLNPDVHVVSYEPSILNVAIGTFNCLLNGVVDRVDIVPFAVLATTAGPGDENSKMLVDFMSVPLLGQKIDVRCKGEFDFVKTDIEGYELELLGCDCFRKILKSSKNSHLELHLGHLNGKGVGVKDWIEALRKSDLAGVELYSGRDMYDFLEVADPKGYYSFLVNRGDN